MLQSYCLDIRHIQGSDNMVADALSRAPVYVFLYHGNFFLEQCISLDPAAKVAKEGVG